MSGRGNHCDKDTQYTNLAAPAKRFLELGALGSAARDLAARRSLLDAVDVFFKLRTKADFVSSS